MELLQIVRRYAEAFQAVDTNTTTQRFNRRTGEAYRLGLPSLGEETALREADAEWDAMYPDELITPMSPRRNRPPSRLDYPYPHIGRTNCDHVFSTQPAIRTAEWAVEAKFISFVGDNGKNNDFGVGKMLSPYLKDRGVLHDAARLRTSEFTDRVAVVMYAFDHDDASCEEAVRRHPAEADVVGNIRDVIRKNGAPLTARPVIEILDAVLTLRGFLRGPRVQADFEAWRHPTGGRGTVFGWEIRRPHLEPGYDPRNPW